MTAGTVVILGAVGHNFGAGMSNGVAYVLDLDDTLVEHCNRESVAACVLAADEEDQLRALIRAHFDQTHSPRARVILQGWTRYCTAFRAVKPHHAAAVPASEAPAVTTQPTQQ